MAVALMIIGSVLGVVWIVMLVITGMGIANALERPSEWDTALYWMPIVAVALFAGGLGLHIVS